MIKKPFTRFERLLSSAREIARDAADKTTTKPVIETPSEDKTIRIKSLWEETYPTKHLNK